MRHLWGLVLALALVALPTSSAFARVAVIGTTARLTEDSERGMQTAVLEAMRLALQGAKGMGLPHVTVQHVIMLDAETVVVELVASDTALEGEDPEGPASRDSSGSRLPDPARFGR
jgi:hypothetical protein